jgi:NTE family protein
MTRPLRVALSGSGFRLAAHLGALQAIADAGYEVIELAGTSGGSIVSALYASGMALADMHQLCMSIDWSPMMRFSLLDVVRYQALCSGDALLEYLREATGGRTFAQLDVDLKIVAADLLTEREFAFSRAFTPDVPIAVAARASASIPLVFPPVEAAGSLLVDGGTCNNVPASRLTVDDVPRVGIYLVSDDTPLAPGGRYGIGTVVSRVIDLMLAANEVAHNDLAKHSGATIVHVPTGYASSLDRNMSVEIRQRLYNDGYAATRAALPVATECARAA